MPCSYYTVPQPSTGRCTDFSHRLMTAAHSGKKMHSCDVQLCLTEIQNEITKHSNPPFFFL